MSHRVFSALDALIVAYFLTVCLDFPHGTGYPSHKRKRNFQHPSWCRFLGRWVQAYWPTSSYKRIHRTTDCKPSRKSLHLFLADCCVQMTSVILSDSVQQFLIPQVRQQSYGTVKNKRLQALLEKLAKYGSSARDAEAREKGEKRRKEAEAVGRLFPGEGRWLRRFHIYCVLCCTISQVKTSSLICTRKMGNRWYEHHCPFMQGRSFELRKTWLNDVNGSNWTSGKEHVTSGVVNFDIVSDRDM